MFITRCAATAFSVGSENSVPSVQDPLAFVTQERGMSQPVPRESVQSVQEKGLRVVQKTECLYLRSARRVCAVCAKKDF
eukprot:5043199-Amphidinium_carterae.1